MAHHTYGRLKNSESERSLCVSSRNVLSRNGWAWNAHNTWVKWGECVLVYKQCTSSAMREWRKIELVPLRASNAYIHFWLSGLSTELLRLGMHKHMHAASLALCPTLLLWVYKGWSWERVWILLFWFESSISHLLVSS